MTKKNVFVIALDAFNRRKLESLRIASECVFHRLCSDELLEGDDSGYDVDAIIEEGEKQLEGFEGSIDAILAYRDFPETTVVPILAKRFGVPAATLESVLACEHKYWSRVEQKKAIADHIPDFVRFDPFDDDVRSKIPFDYPFWVKPVKSFSSHLGFRIESDADLERAMEKTRAHVRRLTDPFDRVLALAELPEEIGGVGQTWCMAETIIGGKHQCTLEGCVYQGKVYTFGVVDSVRYPNRSSFFRYQYPSQLPRRVQDEMSKIAEALVKQIGYDDAPFNIEFFWDEDNDEIWFLEINPRIALHHADLFEKVDGLSNYEMAVDVALGREPSFPREGGSFPCAATFFWREFEDALVTRLPTPERLLEIESSVPGTLIELAMHEGQKLSELLEQDSYSYVVALIYVGGDDEEQLVARYQQVVEQLDIGLSRAVI